MKRHPLLLAAGLLAASLSHANAASTYQVIPGSYTWHSARTDAEARGGHLATITSQAELDRIIQVVNASGFRRYWIGAYDQGGRSFTWVTGEAFEFANWFSGNPSGDGPGVEMFFPGGEWNDLPGTNPGYILELPDDGDGIPDQWELDNFGDLTTANESTDTDKDGRSDKQEHVDATDPNDDGSTLGLQLYYPFEGDASDASGNGNDGIPNGVSPAADRFGVANKAYSFDGVDDYINASNNQIGNLNSHATICYWVYSEGDSFKGAERRIIEKDDFSWWMFIIRQDNNLYYSTSDSGGVQQSGSGVLADRVTLQDTWRWLVVTKNEREHRFYVDGELVSTMDASHNLVQTNAFLTIGRSNFWRGQYFSGKVDDIRIYDRTLSEAEILALYDPNTTYTVTFNLGANGTRTGGGELIQTVNQSEAATAPLVDANVFFVFTGWDVAFDNITAELIVTAIYEADDDNDGIGNSSDPDQDGDGLIDAWELDNFGNLDRDGSGDFDGDGLDDRSEQDNELDPTVSTVTAAMLQAHRETLQRNHGEVLVGQPGIWANGDQIRLSIQLWASDDLADFVELGDPVEFIAPAPSDRESEFYRISVE